MMSMCGPRGARHVESEEIPVHPEEKLRQSPKEEAASWGWGHSGAVDLRSLSWTKEAADLRQLVRDSAQQLQGLLQAQNLEIEGLKKQIESIREAEEALLTKQLQQVKLTTAELTVKLNTMEEQEEETVRQQLQTISTASNAEKQASLSNAGLKELKEELQKQQAKVHTDSQVAQQTNNARHNELKAKADELAKSDAAKWQNISQMRENLMGLQTEKERLAKRDLPMLRQELVVIKADIKTQDCELRAEIAALREELRREIEVTAIKTGHLALTAAGCDTDERRKVYNVLKNREREISEAVSGISTYASGRGAIEYSSVSPLAPGTATLGLSPVLGEFDPHHEFEVKVDRSFGEVLGVELDANDGKMLRVIRLKDGVLRKYNRTCEPPDVPVNFGDLIVQVNGIRGSASLMLKELEKRVPLTIRFLNGEGR